MIKKVFAFILMAAMFVQPLTGAHAQSVPALDYPTGGMSPLVCGEPQRVMQRPGVSAYASQTAADVDEQLYERFCSTIKNRGKKVNIYDLRISADDFRKTVFTQYQRAALACPAYLAITSCSYSCTNAGVIYEVDLKYLTNDESVYNRYAAEMRQRVDYYISLAEDIPDNDIVGKMLVIHDAFVNENVYAHAELNEFNPDVTSEWVIYTAYGALVNKRAVCQGNTLALNMIYEELNERLKAKLGTDEDLIGTGMCLSEAINHIWNCARIDGEWYFIDETWNDAISDRYDGGGTHNFFLSSADWFENTDLSTSDTHGSPSDWEIYSINVSEPVECTSKKYESGYIFNSKSLYTGSDGTTLNCGTYFGTVSYDGKYIIDVTYYYTNGGLYEYTNMKNRYISSGIKSYGILLGENYRENNLNHIEYFVTEEFENPIYLIALGFDGSKMTEVSSREFTAASQGAGNNGILTFGAAMTGKKLLMRYSGFAEPASEARTIE